MIEACAGLVARGDPERYAAVMAAPVAARAVLLPLYAFNLEIARAAWVTKEPMIAEMRLQFWRDVLAEAAAGRPARAHEVAGPLAGLIRAQGLPVAVLDRMVEARRWDVYAEPFADRAAFDAYLEDSGAGLMWVCARALGAPEAAEAGVRAFGWGVALAGFLRAVPELEARGRIPLVDGRAEAVAELAAEGLARIRASRPVRRRLRGLAGAATFAGWQAEGLLTQVLADPGRVAEGQMGLSEFARRFGLLKAAVLGRV